MDHILVADDSEDLLEMLSFVFRRQKTSLITANSKEALWSQLNKILPDIILLDALFSDTDGRLICKELKQNSQFKNTPVILMSGNPLLLKDYKEYQADDILEKPFLTEELLSKINNFRKN